MITPAFLRRLFCAALCLLGSAAYAEQQDTPPVEMGEPGQGYSLGNSGFFLGGYAAISYEDFKSSEAKAAIDSLSAFVSWEGARGWGLFAEIELQNALLLRRGGTTTNDARPILERLHLDYAWSDALQFRLGKFLTPVGRWNAIHAAPLTWTTSRPLITEATFPTNATGAMVRGIVPVHGRALEWSVYASPGQELFPEPGLDTFSEAYGLHLNYELPGNLQFGLSLVDFEQRFEQDQHKTLYGFDVLWSWQRFEVMGEWALRSLSRGNSKSDERGFYLQGLAPLHGNLFAVGRYESFDPAGTNENFHFYLAGLAWRVQPGTLLKAEFSRSIENSVGAPEGFRASIAVLF